jgi:hypothetical protein
MSETIDFLFEFTHYGGRRAFNKLFGFHAGDSEAEQRRMMHETRLVVVDGAANVDRHAPSSPHRSNPARGHLHADQTISERRIVSAALKK